MLRGKWRFQNFKYKIVYDRTIDRLCSMFAFYMGYQTFETITDIFNKNDQYKS